MRCAYRNNDAWLAERNRSQLVLYCDPGSRPFSASAPGHLVELIGRHFCVSLVLERIDRIQIRVASYTVPLNTHWAPFAGLSDYALNRGTIESFGAQSDVDGLSFPRDPIVNLRFLRYSPALTPIKATGRALSDPPSLLLGRPAIYESITGGRNFVTVFDSAVGSAERRRMSA